MSLRRIGSFSVNARESPVPRPKGQPNPAARQSQRKVSGLRASATIAKRCASNPTRSAAINPEETKRGARRRFYIFLGCGVTSTASGSGRRRKRSVVAMERYDPVAKCQARAPPSISTAIHQRHAHRTRRHGSRLVQDSADHRAISS